MQSAEESAVGHEHSRSRQPARPSLLVFPHLACRGDQHLGKAMEHLPPVEPWPLYKSLELILRVAIAGRLLKVKERATKQGKKTRRLGNLVGLSKLDLKLGSKGAPPPKASQRHSGTAHRHMEISGRVTHGYQAVVK